jgi:hypothetical protein
MTDYTELVACLRQLNLKYGDMAADALEDQAKRIAELEAALKLFTELGDNFSDSEVMERIRQARKTLGEKDD